MLVRHRFFVVPLLRQSSRTLFTLPDLSSLSPFSSSNNSSGPGKYHERKILPYNQKQLYRIVADVESYSRFVPFCTASRVLRTSPYDDTKSVTTMDAELTVGFLTFRESYVSKVTCKPYEMVQAEASSSTPLFDTLTTTWRFQPASSVSPHQNYTPLTSALKHSPDAPIAEPSPTLVTLDLVYAFANPLHASVSAAFFGQVSKMMVHAFEERCLSVYGPGLK